MLVQLLLGSFLIVLTGLVAGFSWWSLEALLIRLKRRFMRPPIAFHPIGMLSLAMLWILLMMTASVWIWAIAFHLLQIFETFEACVYFSLVAFTTLGFGDILLPMEWRLLGGLAAANGLLIFGLLSAMLVETLSQIRGQLRLMRSVQGDGSADT